MSLRDAKQEGQLPEHRNNKRFLLFVMAGGIVVSEHIISRERIDCYHEK